MARAFRSSGFRSTKSFSKMSSGSKGVKTKTTTKTNAKAKTETKTTSTTVTERQTTPISGYAPAPTTNVIHTSGNDNFPFWYLLLSRDNDNNSRPQTQETTAVPKEPPKEVEQEASEGFSFCEMLLSWVVIIATTWYVAKKLVR